MMMACVRAWGIVDYRRSRVVVVEYIRFYVKWIIRNKKDKREPGSEKMGSHFFKSLKARRDTMTMTNTMKRIQTLSFDR